MTSFWKKCLGWILPTPRLRINMSKKEISDEQWADEVSRELVEETFKLLQGRGMYAFRLAAVNFIARFVGVLTHEALRAKPKGKLNKEEQYKFVEGNFMKVKASLQECVAAGVQGAVSTFSGRKVEYYCVIKPVPEPVNKQLC